MNAQERRSKLLDIVKCLGSARESFIHASAHLLDSKAFETSLGFGYAFSEQIEHDLVLMQVDGWLLLGEDGYSCCSDAPVSKDPEVRRAVNAVIDCGPGPVCIALCIVNDEVARGGSGFDLHAISCRLKEDNMKRFAAGYISLVSRGFIGGTEYIRGANDFLNGGSFRGNGREYALGYCHMVAMRVTISEGYSPGMYESISGWQRAAHPVCGG